MTMKKPPVNEWVSARNDEALLADGFDEAFVGVVDRFGFDGRVAVYDKDKCIKILVDRDGLSHEEALEHFEFNVIGAWVGEYTPMYMNMYQPEGNEIWS